MSATQNRPNKLWPIGSRVTVVDAWGRNPIDGKIVRHIGEDQVIVDDVRDVRHCAQTWRLVSAPPPKAADMAAQFEDLLG